MVMTGPADRPLPCKRCVLADQCLTSVVDRSDLTADRSLLRTVTLAKGEQLFEAGEQATSLYVVRSGAMCASRPNGYGVQQILSFSLEGDVIAASALHNDEYQVTVRAVQPAVLCSFSLELLHRLSSTNDRLLRFFRRSLGNELKRNRDARLLLTAPRADTRVASFLAWYIEVLAKRRILATRFRLPVSRAEMASHLGLAVESVSRALSDLRAEGILEARGREIAVLDACRLQEVAGSKQFRRLLLEPERRCSADGSGPVEGGGAGRSFSRNNRSPIEHPGWP